MRNILLLSVLSLFIAAPAFATAPTTPATAPAATPAVVAANPNHFPPVVMAVVDMQKIMQDSSAAKSVRDQLTAKRQSYQQEITADEQKLHAAEQALREQQPKLSAEDFAKKRTEFEAQVRKVQETVQKRTRALDEAFNKALGIIKQSLGKIVATAASEKGATLVLDKGQVIVVESKFDITTTVLERLNKDLPRVEVTIPAAAH